MANERLIERLQHVDRVRRDLAAFLVRLGVSIRAAIAGLRRGVPASAHTAEATEVHVELVQKLDDMHSAVHQARAEGVRVLVEDEGLPVGTVARLMGRPRQLVGRLYQQGRSGSGGLPERDAGNAGEGTVSLAGGERGDGGVSRPAPDRPSAAPSSTRIPPAR